MSRHAIPLIVVMDGGQEHKVTADQRDLARLEATDLNDANFLRIRHLGWTAATRAKVYTGTWDEFAEDCIEVVGADDDADAEDGGGLDPGRTGRTGPG